jgi:pimeloyl-ACP methyl ester carboxylesterase
MRTWEPQIRTLVEVGFRVVRFDQRGYGTSSIPEKTYSSVDDTIAVLDERGIDTAAFVGCSMGGAVALQTVIEHPERAWALVPVASGLPGFPWDEELEATLFAPIEAAMDAGDLVLATDEAMKVWAALGTGDPVGARIHEIALDNTQNFEIDEELDVWAKYPTYDHLEEIDVPTLVIVGDVLATRIPGARKILIEQADHVVNMRQPEAFDAAVLPFLLEAQP